MSAGKVPLESHFSSYAAAIYTLVDLASDSRKLNPCLMINFFEKHRKISQIVCKFQILQVYACNMEDSYKIFMQNLIQKKISFA